MVAVPSIYKALFWFILLYLGNMVHRSWNQRSDIWHSIPSSTFYMRFSAHTNNQPLPVIYLWFQCLFWPGFDGSRFSACVFVIDHMAIFRRLSVLRKKFPCVEVFLIFNQRGWSSKPHDNSAGVRQAYQLFQIPSSWLPRFNLREEG